MSLFYVAVREHTYTGRFYSEAVQAESPEEALQAAAEHAAVPPPPPAPTPQQVFDVAVTGPPPLGGWIPMSCRPRAARRRCRRPPSRLPRPNRGLVPRRRQRPQAGRGVPMSGSTPCCTASWRQDTIPRIWRSHTVTDDR